MTELRTVMGLLTKVVLLVVLVTGLFVCWSRRQHAPIPALQPSPNIPPALALIRQNSVRKRLRDEFIMSDTLGKGGFGEVRIGTDRQTGFVRAIKVMSKRRELFGKDEIAIMLSLDHPNVIKLFQTYEDDSFHYLVMELCEGKSLLDFLQAVYQKQFLGSCSEKDWAGLMRQMLQGVNYLHGRGICHRDIKPENCMFSKPSFCDAAPPLEENVLKLIDFGLAGGFPAGDLDSATLRGKMGTLSYIAPELLTSQRYGPKCDIWSCGVSLYCMLSGSMPFVGEAALVQRRIKEGSYFFPSARWKNVSEPAVELVKLQLTVAFAERPSAAEAAQHRWIMKQAPAAPMERLSVHDLEGLRCFTAACAFKKRALQVVARHMKESDLGKLREAFMAMDKDGSGTLTTEEFRQGLLAAHELNSGGALEMPEMEESCFSAIDDNNSGLIDYTEFLAAAIARREIDDETLCWAVFRVFDKDGDQQISKRELVNALENEGEVAERIGNHTIEHIMREHDLNGDGYIDYDEFKQMLRNVWCSHS